MKHEVAWNADIIFNFVKYGKLDNEQIKIMQLRTSNHSDAEIAEKCNISVPTYYRRVKELKKIYDNVIKNYPELNMPERNLINERLFDVLDYEHALDFISHIDWENEKLEIKIIRKNKMG